MTADLRAKPLLSDLDVVDTLADANSGSARPGALLGGCMLIYASFGDLHWHG